MKVCNNPNPLDPDRGGLKNTIGCLLSVIYIVIQTQTVVDYIVSTYNHSLLKTAVTLLMK